MTTTKAPKLAEIPTDADGLRGWVEEQQTNDRELARVRTRDREMRERLAELDGQHARLLGGLEHQVHELTERAHAVLEHGVVPRPADLDHDRARQDDERRVLMRALELHREEVDRETARVSRALCEVLRPRHREIVQRMAAALHALDVAAAEEENMRFALRDAGVLGFAEILRPMPPPGTGLLRHEQSRIGGWFTEARTHGLSD